MPYQVFDYRTDVKSLFFTSRIRSRFLKMEPGEVARRHSHDLGHEIFLIMEGICDMEIDGQTERLLPGQMCVAWAHQMHQASNPGTVPMTMYLSVTPHVEPTHTHYDPDTGQRLPPHYNPPGSFDQPDRVAGIPTVELAERQLQAFRQFAATVQAAADAHERGIAALKAATQANDQAGLVSAMDGLWEHVRASHDQLDAMTNAWNDLAPRAAKRP